MPTPRDLDPTDKRPGRRAFLRLTGRAACACLAAPVLHQLTGCGSGQQQQQAPQSLRVPLADLPDGQRTYHTINGVPVEVRREGDQFIARSLRCTHQGCTVAWQEEHQEYVCPCHEGRFAPDGTVIEGMPSRPLPSYPTRVEGDVVVVEP